MNILEKIKDIESYRNNREKLNDFTVRKTMTIYLKHPNKLVLDIDFERSYWMEPRNLVISDIKSYRGEIRGKIDYGHVDKFGPVILNFFFNTCGDGFLWDWTREDGSTIPYRGFIETALIILRENNLLNK